MRLTLRPNPRVVAFLAILSSCSVSAIAQMRPTLIRDATILPGDGRTIENGAVMITGTKISSVLDSQLLAKFDVPFLTKKIRAKGKFVTPGLIDVWSTLALRGRGSDSPTASAADAYDRFDSDAIKASLAAGVTTIYVPAVGREGFSGRGAIVRLIPGGPASDVVLKTDVAMCATLGGLSGQGAISRITTAAALRRMFDDAKQHREALDYYKEDLEEYEKKVKERAEKEAAEKKDDKKDEKKPEDKKEVKKEPPKEEPRRPTPPPGGPRRRPRSAADATDAAHTDFAEHADSAEGSAADESFADEEPDKKPAAKPGEEKKDEIQKPPEPARDAVKDLLLKVVEGELPLRVVADRPEDILNAVEIAEAYNLRLVIEGGTGAHLVADRLAAREIPVVLRSASPPQQFVGGAWRYFDPSAVATLREAGCAVYCGSGPDAESATRSLALRAAQLAGSDPGLDDALALVTSKAAAFLGIDEQLGRLEPGQSGDLVIWSEHPLSPGARVERVFINGQEVYRAPKPDGNPSDEKDDES